MVVFRKLPGWRTLRIGLLAGGLIACAVTVQAQDVHLHLVEDVSVSSRVLRVADVCQLTTQDTELSRRIASLPLGGVDELPTGSTITADFLRIRVALGGVPIERITTSGAQAVFVRFQPPQPVTDADVESAAAATMARALNVSLDDLKVRLVSPYIGLLPERLRGQAGLRLEVLDPIRPQLGQTALQVRIWNGRRLEAARPARVEILRRFDVAVARVTLQRDHVIRESDVQFESRFLATEADEPQEDQIVGRTVRTPVRPGTVLSLRDLNPATATKNAIVVKPRDPVRVTAISGPMRVTLRTAEAVQAGRVGDLIKIRNPETNAIRSGVVTAVGEVEMRLRD